MIACSMCIHILCSLLMVEHQQTTTKSSKNPSNITTTSSSIENGIIFQRILACECIILRRISREKEVKNAANELREVRNSRDALHCEVAELKVQLKIVEEARDSFRHNLLDANRQLHEGQIYCYDYVCACCKSINLSVVFCVEVTL